jgi:hypothetical protein
MSPVKNEKKTDDDLFNAITEGDLKKKKVSTCCEDCQVQL